MLLDTVAVSGGRTYLDCAGAGGYFRALCYISNGTTGGAGTSLSVLQSATLPGALLSSSELSQGRRLFAASAATTAAGSKPPSLLLMLPGAHQDQAPT